MTIQLEGHAAEYSISQEEVTAIVQKWDVADGIVMNFVGDSLGFMFPQKPVTPLHEVLNATHTNLEGEAYTRALGNALLWFNYCGALHAYYDQKVYGYKKALEEIAAKIRNNLRKAAEAKRIKKPNEQEMDDLVATNMYYSGLAVDMHRVTTTVKMLAKNLSSIDRGYQAISRSVTIRGQELELELSSTSGRRGFRG